MAEVDVPEAADADVAADPEEGNEYSRVTAHDNNAFFNSTAKKLFDAVMERHGVTFDSIGLEDLEGDNSIVIMSDFVERCCRTPPISRHTKRPYSATTLADSLSCIIRKLKEKFRTQSENLPPFFPTDLEKQWRKKLKDDHNRTLMQGDDESDVLKSTYPLPRKSGVRTRFLPDNELPHNQQVELSKVDLITMARKLFGSNQFLDLLMLLLTYSGIGRGGEIKFLTYNSWMFDAVFCILFVQWFQRKNLKTNPSGFVPDFEFPELCVFLLLGCYWSCNDGLFRPEGIGTPKSPLRRKSRYVFQSLHKINDSSVTDKLTRLIRGLVPTELKSFFSSRSCRVGAMTYLSWDPAVTYEEAVALGGWSTPSNRDWYVWTYLVAIIPAVLSLAGYPDPRVIPYLPKYKKLLVEGNEQQQFSVDKWNLFINHLFKVTLPEFLPLHNTPNAPQEGRGRHRELLHVVAAVMVMHFEYLHRKYTASNAYVQKMMNAVITCGMATGHVDAVIKLNFWSSTLKTDFTNENTNPTDPERDILRRGTIQDQLNKMNQNILKLVETRTQMQEQLNLHLQSQKAMQQEINSLRGQVQAMNTMNNSILTNVRWVMVQNRAIMRKLEIPINVNVEQRLPNAEDPLQPPNIDVVETGIRLGITPPTVATTANVTPTPATTTPTITANATVNAVAPAMAPPQARATRPTPQAATRPTPQAATRPTPQATAAGTPAAGIRDIRNVLTFAPPLSETRNNRGANVPTQNLDSVLQFLYDFPSNAKLRSLLTGAVYLAHLAPDVSALRFNRANGALSKIKKVFNVVDAIWTPQERLKLANHDFENDDEARKTIDDITHRVRQACHVFKQKQPTHHKYTSSSGKGILGLANQIGKDYTKKVEDYIPAWNVRGQPMKSTRVLQAVVDELTENLRVAIATKAAANARNPYSRNYNKRRRTGR